jgi:hypothetical protein
MPGDQVVALRDCTGIVSDTSLPERARVNISRHTPRSAKARRRSYLLCTRTVKACVVMGWKKVIDAQPNAFYGRLNPR